MYTLGQPPPQSQHAVMPHPQEITFYPLAFNLLQYSATVRVLQNDRNVNNFLSPNPLQKKTIFQKCAKTKNLLITV